MASLGDTRAAGSSHARRLHSTAARAALFSARRSPSHVEKAESEVLTQTGLTMMAYHESCASAVAYALSTCKADLEPLPFIRPRGPATSPPTSAISITHLALQTHHHSTHTYTLKSTQQASKYGTISSLFEPTAALPVTAGRQQPR